VRITSPVTHHRRPLLAFVFALFASLLFWSNAGVADAQTRPSAVVFTVSGSGAEGSMDAVVLVEGKQLRAPYNSKKEDAQKKFGEQYFAAGKSTG